MGDRPVWEIEEEMESHQQEGNVGAVMDLVDELGNMQDKLFAAVVDGDLNDILYYESLGFDITDSSYLKVAAQYGQCKIIEFLINQGSDAHAEVEEPLYVACINNQLEAVRCLISKGAIVHAGIERAIKVSAENDFLDIVQLLVASGSSIEAVLDIRNLADYHKEVYKWAHAYKQAKDLKDGLEKNLDDGGLSARKAKV
ncbi:ankyrin repeat domain-containing protein [Ralstonia pseudosolanacearum]|uniref:ankyrin repeat domain-containing protein n=1 Tax=Ralstonia pseudosolanacearum TaxID=1310165 RepID=UPI003D048A9A